VVHGFCGCVKGGVLRYTATMERFAVIRVPTSGPPALIGAPCDFATRAEAQARIDAIEAGHLKAHHTYLDIVAYEGPLGPAMRDLGVQI